jgi:nicotinamide-nucleotide amidase
MKINLICIGDELLIGQVINTNASWIGQFLNQFGFNIHRTFTIGDAHQEIFSTLRIAFESAEMVITTGGLGPTRDDISKKAIADFFGLGMTFHQQTWDRIYELFTKRNIPISDQHRDQCLMPDGAEVLENGLGTAPGLWLEKQGKHCIMLPGVPYEMQHLMERHVKPALISKFQAEEYFEHTFLTVGTGESVIADHIQDFEESLGEHSGIAYLPGTGQVRIRISQRGGLKTTFENNRDKLGELIKHWTFGENGETLESAVGKLLKDNGLTLVLAESCTGGLISHKITSIAGSSAYFKGAAITYSNEHKMKVLGVKSETLEKYGAVSEQTVIEMVQGALTNLGGEIAAAVSGIAGPDGGSEEKPVGTVWIAVGNKQQIKTISFIYMKDRERNIQYAAVQALNMIRKFLIAVYLK